MAGMKKQISKFLKSKIAAGDFPSAVCLVAERGEIKFHEAYGLAVVEPEKIAARPETIYDLASLTKVLVTGLLGARLIEKGEIRQTDKVAGFFPEFDTDEKREMTVLNLLTHTSGFPAWKPFYVFSESKSQVRRLISKESLENPINSKVVYSDLNFLMLGFLWQKIYRQPLDEIARREIFEPLQLGSTFFNPPKSRQKEIAASEEGNKYEETIVREMFPGIDIQPGTFRDQVIWGEVHDNNCFFMGGVAGHAGLFSNAFETFRLARQFLPETSEILKPETCQLFKHNFTPELGQARSLAFQLAETGDSTASEALAKNSFGHLGFTGTSLWIEPAAERIFILLTNRTHHRSLPLADLKETRQDFHRLAIKEPEFFFGILNFGAIIAIIVLSCEL
jgi:CubicO group peptidase (beta-lactamase class C family)